MNKIDKILLDVVAVCFFTVVFYLVTKVLIVGMFIGYLTWVTARSALYYFIARKNLTKNITVKEMENVFAVWGTEKQAEFLYPLFPECYNPQLDGNRISFLKNRKKIVFLCNYKFSPTSLDDIAKLYRDTASRADTTYILGKRPTTEVFSLIEKLSMDLVFIPSEKVRKELIKHNHMPENFVKKKKRKPTWKEALSQSFAPEKTKYYYLSSITFVFYGIINLYRGWFLAFAALNFILGSICFLQNIKQSRRNGKK